MPKEPSSRVLAVAISSQPSAGSRRWMLTWRSGSPLATVPLKLILRATIGAPRAFRVTLAVSPALGLVVASVPAVGAVEPPEAARAGEVNMAIVSTASRAARSSLVTKRAPSFGLSAYGVS